MGNFHSKTNHATVYASMHIYTQDLTQTCKILLQNTGISRGKKGLFYNYALQTTYNLENLWKKSFVHGCVSANL